jgi:Polyketide cyclase / dehydrase and lipid transport
VTLTATRFIRATPDEVWALISRTGSWPLWGPSVSAVEPVDETLSCGMRGRVRTPAGIWLPFHITGFDPPRSWAWSVLSIPATTHSVEPAPGGSRISFSVPTPALPYLVVCRLALTRIAALLESSDTQAPPRTSGQ